MPYDFILYSMMGLSNILLLNYAGWGIGLTFSLTLVCPQSTASSLEANPLQNVSAVYFSSALDLAMPHPKYDKCGKNENSVMAGTHG